MTMVKPIALAKSAFDATKNEIFYFTTSGGNQVVKNKITIRKNSDNTVVYTNFVETYAFQQTVPAHTLSNNTYYNYYFNTYDVNGNISEDSSAVSFYCYTTPTVTFTNLTDNTEINSSSYDFTIQYNQEEGELLDFVIINLYKSDGTELGNSGNLYSTQVPPISFDYNFNGFENNSNYKIQAVATTVNNTVVKSDMLNFSIIYAQPVLYSRLELENKCKDGYVQIRSNMISVDGITDPTPPVYITKDVFGFPYNNNVIPSDYPLWEKSYQMTNNIMGVWNDDTAQTFLDISIANQYVRWEQGFNIQKDYTIRAWLEPTTLYKMISFYNDTLANGYILSLVRKIPYGETTVKDFLELKGYVNGELKVYQRSNYTTPMTTNDLIQVYIRKVGTTYTLNLTYLQNDTTASNITWGTSNVDYNTLTDSDCKWGSETYEQETTAPTLLNNTMDNIFPLNMVQLNGGIYDEFDITKDVTSDFSDNTIHTKWGYDTELNCNFNDNVLGGNVQMVLSQLSAIKIKHREYGTNTWLSLYEKPVTVISDLTIDLPDYYVPSNKKFEWAIVPIMQDGSEGDYIIKSLTTKFDGTFVTNGDNNFKLYNGVTLGNGIRNTSIGQLQPINRKYPIIIQNSNINYYSNTITALILGYNYDSTRTIDRNDVVEESNDLQQFLISGKAFCIKDWNGNIWIARSNAVPTMTYNASYGNGVVYLTLSFVEQGQYNNQTDMYNNGLIDTLS